MPSSGYGMTDILEGIPLDQRHKFAQVVEACAQIAMRQGLFIEWLESFLSAWAATKNPVVAANAGLEEWDL
jgi:hypothetical protein